MDEASVLRLSAWLAGPLSARHVTIKGVSALKGGAIQENWWLDVVADGTPRALVLRKDAPATISASHNRRDEFALLSLAHRGGVTVPEPIGFCEDAAVLGSPFAVMAKVGGTALGPKVVKDMALAPDREALGRRLGHELALIHRLDASGPDFAFLETGPGDVPSLIARLRASLDAMGAVRPALEWGLRWAELNTPRAARTALCHNDFRTGNLMLDGAGLTAVLDWEFAGFGDPMADLGWFCAACWRFSRQDLDGGGLTSRDAFYAGYEATSGTRIDHGAVLYWEAVAHMRWGVIALQQGHRHVSGEQPSLELALTGRMIAELERGVLAATGPSWWRQHHGC